MREQSEVCRIRKLAGIEQLCMLDKLTMKVTQLYQKIMFPNYASLLQKVNILINHLKVSFQLLNQNLSQVNKRLIYTKDISSIKIKMKKATVLGISANQKLIVVMEGQQYLQSKFQGFQITEDFRFRHCFDELLNKEIQCSFNKYQKTLRYQNGLFFVRLLQRGALSINKKQLEQSKIFTSEQKSKFYSISKPNQNQILSQLGKNLNQKCNFHILQSIINEKKKIRAKIQYLSDFLLISLSHENKSSFLKCKLQNYKHYFQLFPQLTFWQGKILPAQFDVKIVSQKYNILSRNFECFVSLQEQFNQKLLRGGYVALNPKNYFANSIQSFKNILSIQTETIRQNKGIYSSKSQILSFLYTKDNFVGVVTNIIEGYIYQITVLKTKLTRKVQLSVICCPIGDDSGSFDCRQFARNQLIGKEVNVYLQKQGSLNTKGSIVRIQDWKDIESILLENGFAMIKQQFRNTIISQKFSGLERKAKQKRKGIHRKDVGNKRFQDLTVLPCNKQYFKSYMNRRQQMLKQFTQNQIVVIQAINDTLNYKVRVQSKSVLINLRLQGILQPFINPNIQEYRQIKQQSDDYLKVNFLKKNMIGLITGYDQENNSFVGTLYSEKLKVDVQELLIRACIVYADKYNPVSSYLSLENEVKKTQKLIWQPKLRCFQPGLQLDKVKHCFQGRFSWIHNGKLVYIQPQDNSARLQKLQNKIREGNLVKLVIQKQKVGAWCVAPFQGQLYRAVIKSKKNTQFTVQYIDWGNVSVVNTQLLRQMPQEYLYLQRQCICVSLNLVSSTKDLGALEKVRQMLFDGGVYVFKKVCADLVDFFDGEQGSVNEDLIFKGLLKADKQDMKRHANRQVIKDTQEELRKQRVGIWEESDQSSDGDNQLY